MIAISSKYEHLLIYIHEENVFVWSKNSHSAYIFEGVFGALFFLIEEHGYCVSPDKYLKLLGLKQNSITLAFIKQINKLIYKKESCKSPIKEEVYLVNTSSIRQLHFQSEGLVCALYNTFFHLYCDKDLNTSIYSIFNYLKAEKNSIKNIPYFFSIKLENKVYNLYVNDEKKESVTKEENILCVLMDLIRVTLYVNNDYLVAFHAASLVHKNRAYIFPGISGSGKSTLSTFLMYNGFKLCSDEATIIDRTYNIKSIPLPITIKEGSWNIVKDFVKNFNFLPTYKRLDGQNIKFVIPTTAVHKKSTFSDIIIIFPKYKDKSPIKLRKLTVVEALKTLKETQYQLEDPYSFTVVKQFLTFLFSTRVYMLTYSNLSEAMSALNELNNNE